MNVVSVSFEIGDKLITLKHDMEGDEEIAKTVNILLKESEEIGLSGKASAGQLGALYARAFAVAWDKEKVEKLLECRLNTSSRNEIVGVVDRQVLSRLIDEIGVPPEVPGKASVGQVRVFWAKALSKGWERARIREFLQEKIGVSRDAQIVGQVDKSVISSVIDQLAAA